MNKIWYINVEGREEGPYSFLDLKRDPRLTPDLLVRRNDWPKNQWIPIRNVKELQDLFKDDEDETEEPESKKGGPKSPVATP